MSDTITEPRYPLHLTLGQLNDLKSILDTVSAGVGDPDADIFALLEQVREARKKAAGLLERNLARAADVLARRT